MHIVLSVIQIIVALSLIGLIAIQGKSGGLGGTFGAGYASFGKRRGIEKFVFILTIAGGGVFLALSIISLFI